MSFLRKSMLISAGQLCGTALGMAVGILYSRTLGPDGVGQFELLRHTAIVTLTLFSLGLGNANIYFLNNRGIPMPDIVSNTLKATAGLGLLATAALLGGLLRFPDYFGHVSAGVASCLALGVGLSVVMWALRALLVARIAARWLVAYDLVNPLVLVTAGGALALSGRLRTETAILVMSVAICAGLAVVLTYLRRDIDLRRRFDWRLFRQVLAYGIKLATANLLLVLLGSTCSISVLLLRYLCPDQFTEVGLFTRAVAACALIRLAPQALGPLLYAKWSGVRGEARIREVELAARMSSSYGLAAAAFLLVAGKYVLWLLYGAQFIPAKEALSVLAASMAFVTIFEVCYNLLAGDGRALLSVYVLSFQLVLTCAVTYVMVPNHGSLGAALGVLGGSCSGAVVVLWACCRLYGLDPWRCLFLRPSDLAYLRRALRG